MPLSKKKKEKKIRTRIAPLRRDVFVGLLGFLSLPYPPSPTPLLLFSGPGGLDSLPNKAPFQGSSVLAPVPVPSISGDPSANQKIGPLGTALDTEAQHFGSGTQFPAERPRDVSLAA